MRLVLRRGKFFRYNGLKLVWAKLLETGTPHVGFIVSSKVEKTAVVRKRIKRCLRHAALSTIDVFTPSFGYVVVVEQKLHPTTSQFAEALFKELFAALKK